ncbi:alpha/beta fold hydrolase [Candidatus Wolfebacteria bacterium]|nr:alpha/beta fold hydrolase [Candidatus Wolfebacteria bacterium]
MKIKKSLSGVIIGVVALSTIVGLSGLNFLIPAAQNYADDAENEMENPRESAPIMEKITLQTKDGKRLAANLYRIANPLGWIAFFHMMPAQKESWDDLAKEFQNLGYESLAIDFRGHGESDAGPTGYQNFSDKEQQKKILDLEAAVDYLIKNRRAAPQKISLLGASIGANLSLKYLSEHAEFPKAVLLSPGLNYYGIETEPLVRNLKFGQAVFFVGSRDDGRAGGNNAEQNQKLYDAVPAGVLKKIKIYDTAGHGTTMLQKEKELKDLIINFILEQ